MESNLILATTVDTFREKMRRILFRKATLLVFAAICGVVDVGVLYLVAREHTHRVSGISSDHASLRNVPELSGFLPIVPNSARNIEYYGHRYVQYFEAAFPFSEAEFIRWACDQGWSVDEITKNKTGAYLMLYNTPGDFLPLEIKEGYWLPSTVIDKDDQVVLNDVRTLAFDTSRQRAYIQLWLGHFKEGRVINESPMFGPGSRAVGCCP
jgi:hypothetical protein